MEERPTKGPCRGWGWYSLPWWGGAVQEERGNFAVELLAAFAPEAGAVVFERPGQGVEVVILTRSVKILVRMQRFTFTFLVT